MKNKKLKRILITSGITTVAAGGTLTAVLVPLVSRKPATKSPVDTQALTSALEIGMGNPSVNNEESVVTTAIAPTQTTTLSPNILSPSDRKEKARQQIEERILGTSLTTVEKDALKKIMQAIADNNPVLHTASPDAEAMVAEAATIMATEMPGVELIIRALQFFALHMGRFYYASDYPAARINLEAFGMKLPGMKAFADAHSALSEKLYANSTVPSEKNVRDSVLSIVNQILSYAPAKQWESTDQYLDALTSNLSLQAVNLILPFLSALKPQEKMAKTSQLDGPSSILGRTPGALMDFLLNRGTSLDFITALKPVLATVAPGLDGNATSRVLASALDAVLPGGLLPNFPSISVNDINRTATRLFSIAGSYLPEPYQGIVSQILSFRLPKDFSNVASTFLHEAMKPYVRTMPPSPNSLNDLATAFLARLGRKALALATPFMKVKVLGIIAGLAAQALRDNPNSLLALLGNLLGLTSELIDNLSTQEFATKEGVTKSSIADEVGMMRRLTQTVTDHAERTIYEETVSFFSLPGFYNDKVKYAAAIANLKISLIQQSVTSGSNVRLRSALYSFIARQIDQQYINDELPVEAATDLGFFDKDKDAVRIALFGTDSFIEFGNFRDYFAGSNSVVKKVEHRIAAQLVLNALEYSGRVTQTEQTYDGLKDELRSAAKLLMSMFPMKAVANSGLDDIFEAYRSGTLNLPAVVKAEYPEIWKQISDPIEEKLRNLPLWQQTGLGITSGFFPPKLDEKKLNAKVNEMTVAVLSFLPSRPVANSPISLIEISNLIVKLNSHIVNPTIAGGFTLPPGLVSVQIWEEIKNTISESIPDNLSDSFDVIRMLEGKNVFLYLNDYFMGLIQRQGHGDERMDELSGLVAEEFFSALLAARN